MERLTRSQLQKVLASIRKRVQMLDAHIVNAVADETGHRIEFENDLEYAVMDQVWSAVLAEQGYCQEDRLELEGPALEAWVKDFCGNYKIGGDNERNHKLDELAKEMIDDPLLMEDLEHKNTKQKLEGHLTCWLVYRLVFPRPDAPDYKE